MKKLVIILIFLFLLIPTIALTQSTPGLYQNQIPTPAQWNSYFAAKQDVLNYSPLNKAGDTMSGKLVTAAPTVSASGLNLPPGTAPSSPVNGDLWTTSGGLYARINGGTVGPFIANVNMANSLGGNVNLNNTANYFDGPSVAQGAVGTWFASGCVTVTDTSAAVIYAKLWDGTTVVASAAHNVAAASNNVSICLSGVLASPAGNIRISARDVTNTSGSILFNVTGNSKDSTVTAVRVQ